MNARLPGSCYDNPIWHRSFRIWQCHDDQERQIFIWCHEAADLDDLYDRRHGDAPTIQQARADIDEYLSCQEFNAEQRRKTGLSAARALYQAIGGGGTK